jgi:CRISPR-associated endonuclease/helicase Cas3
MPWLYRQAVADPTVPTRLVLVLPRRNLTEQTTEKARKRVESAGLGNRIRVIQLMGGSSDNDETLGPHQIAIIIATQDLYFSRALNRGYARRPPRWPIDFALYNQDCLIVLDEVQLMDEALATSTQLAGFRARFGTCASAPCIWMSATARPEWLNTVDFPTLPRQIRLAEDDHATNLVRARTHAPKTLQPAPIECRTPAGCAALAVAGHQPGTRTLVIVNTVARAREVAIAIRKEFHDPVLLHSRFRPDDRRAATARLSAIPPDGQIVIATQVLEAGVDITSRLLITDVAPWSSMVQRFGRVNRYGDDGDSRIYWVEEPTFGKQKEALGPYSQGELLRAVDRLRKLASAAPADLPEEDGPEPYLHALRRADLIDLFDTTPDLAGNELDISRFIRAGEDKNIYLAWRDWPAADEPPKEPDLSDRELCPVSIGEFREFAKKHRVYTLNFATEEWVEIGKDTPLYPGMLAVTRISEGGYSAEDGWSPESKSAVTDLSVKSSGELETDTSDARSFPKYRQTLCAHTDRVIEKLEEILARTQVDERCKNALRAAAVKHDWGKVHDVFQETMHRHDNTTELLAKQCGSGRHRVRHFRHELASALAMLQTGESDLAAYLVAAHHGRIRLGIRSMPGENEGGKLIARGIQEGDELKACELSTGIPLPAVTLSLGPMQLGAESGSWTDRMLRLRDELGPFRLAYLEMLLRAADEGASADQGTEYTKCPISN